jgi:hypothetical protein
MTEALDERGEAFEIPVLRNERDALLAARRSDQCVIDERRLFVEQLPAFPRSDGRENAALSVKAALDGANTPRRRANGSNTPRCTSRAASAVRAPAASSCRDHSWVFSPAKESSGRSGAPASSRGFNSHLCQKTG